MSPNFVIIRDDQAHQFPCPEPSLHDDDYSLLTGSTSTARSYPCSFCHRHFRSAQALGGHMNVHRHHRAQIRVCPAPPSSADSTPLPIDCPPSSFAFKPPSIFDSSSSSFSPPPASSSLPRQPASAPPSLVGRLRASPDLLTFPSVAPLGSCSSPPSFKSLDFLPTVLPQEQDSSVAFDQNRRLGLTAPFHHLKSESSRKKLTASVGFQPYQTLLQKHSHTDDVVEDKESKEVQLPHGLDLELRLGQQFPRLPHPGEPALTW